MQQGKGKGKAQTLKEGGRRGGRGPATPTIPAAAGARTRIPAPRYTCATPKYYQATPRQHWTKGYVPEDHRNRKTHNTHPLTLSGTTRRW